MENIVPKRMIKKIFKLNSVKNIKDKHIKFLFNVIIGSGYEIKDWGDFVKFNLDFNWSIDYPTEYEKWIKSNEKIYPVYDKNFNINPQYYSKGFIQNKKYKNMTIKQLKEEIKKDKSYLMYRGLLKRTKKELIEWLEKMDKEKTKPKKPAKKPVKKPVKKPAKKPVKKPAKKPAKKPVNKRRVLEKKITNLKKKGRVEVRKDNAKIKPKRKILKVRPKHIKSNESLVMYIRQLKKKFLSF